MPKPKLKTAAPATKARRTRKDPVVENVPKFIASWSEQLYASSNQVRNLIGSRHWLTDGHHKERLLERFLADHLPRRCTFGSGFVLPLLAPSQVSRETDILICDSNKTAPLLHSDDFRIIPPSGLIAHVHVKATLTRGSLLDAVETARTVVNACSRCADRSPLACLFFFEHELPSLTKEELEKYFVNPKLALPELLNPSGASGFVIAAGRDLFGVGKLGINQEPSRLVFFQIRNLAAGAFLANILNGVESYFDGQSHRPDLLRAVTQLSGTPITTINL